jgi:hypothetical protein
MKEKKIKTNFEIEPIHKKPLAEQTQKKRN